MRRDRLKGRIDTYTKTESSNDMSLVRDAPLTTLLTAAPQDGYARNCGQLHAHGPHSASESVWESSLHTLDP